MENTLADRGVTVLMELLTLPAWYAEQGLCNGRASVCLSHQSTAAVGLVAGGFAAEHPTGRR